MSDNTVYCADCDHLRMRLPRPVELCAAAPRDPVSGNPARHCSCERSPTPEWQKRPNCGPQGMFFEPRRPGWKAWEDYSPVYRELYAAG
jgi:hypothetical protein